MIVAREPFQLSRGIPLARLRQEQLFAIASLLLVAMASLLFVIASLRAVSRPDWARPLLVNRRKWNQLGTAAKIADMIVPNVVGGLTAAISPVKFSQPKKVLAERLKRNRGYHISRSSSS